MDGDFTRFDDTDSEDERPGGVGNPCISMPAKWFKPGSFVEDDPLTSLHNEILDFCDLLIPTKVCLSVSNPPYSLLMCATLSDSTHLSVP